jgi:hypothetical protein
LTGQAAKFLAGSTVFLCPIRFVFKGEAFGKQPRFKESKYENTRIAPKSSVFVGGFGFGG